MAIVFVFEDMKLDYFVDKAQIAIMHSSKCNKKAGDDERTKGTEDKRDREKRNRGRKKNRKEGTEEKRNIGRERQRKKETEKERDRGKK